MDKHIAILLRNLIYPIFRHGTKEKYLIEETLSYCKRERKGKTWESIVDSGLNIFNNRKTKIADVIQMALDLKYIEIVSLKGQNEVFYTPEGQIFFERYLTNDYSKDFQQYFTEFERILREHDKPRMNKLIIMESFHENKDVLSAANHYTEWFSVEQIGIAYKNEVLNELLNTWREKYVFIFIPKLFVLPHMMKSAVSLKVEGISMPQEILISKPYPNKRYFVGGCKVNSKKIPELYPIVASKNIFPKALKLKLQWYVDGKHRVTHILNLTFDFTDDIGNFFSTCQRFTRGSEIPQVDLATFMGTDDDLWNQRDVTFAFGQNRVQYIYENATLQNVPLEILSHNFTQVNNSFIKNWYKTHRESS